MSEILTLKNIYKKFSQGKDDLVVLDNVSLGLKAGELVGLLGQSGAGKTTLLHIAALLDKPSSGEIIINGSSISYGDEHTRTKLRRENLGFIYQFHHLLDEFTALENVMMPCLIKKMPYKLAKEMAADMLEAVGLKERLNHRPYQLSGGEQQRTSIARALVHQPKILFADEPTGNLDPKTAENVFSILLELAGYHKLTVFLVTHNQELTKHLDHVYSLTDGKINKV